MLNKQEYEYWVQIVCSLLLITAVACGCKKNIAAAPPGTPAAARSPAAGACHHTPCESDGY